MKGMGILFVFGVTVLLPGPGGYLLARLALFLPFIVLASVCLAAAEIRAERDGIRYRRLVRWKFVSYTQVRGAGRALVFGWLRPAKPIPSFGILFFALTSSFRWQNPLVAKIQQNVGGLGHKSRPRTTAPVWFKAAVVAAAGALVVFMAGFLTPSGTVSWLAVGLADSKAPWVRELGWGIAGIVLLVLSVRHDRKLYAFCSGMSLAWFVLAAPYVLHW